MLGSVVSSSVSTVLASTYIGKDIIGQLGGMAYAWKTGKTADKDPKKYMAIGNGMLQMSFYVENASPYIPKEYVLPFLGLSSTLKNISFLSIGAVNAKNLQQLSSPTDNIGYLYSKVASINTLSSTFGMICGISIIHFIPSYTLRTTYVLPVLSAISLYSTNKATSIANKKLI
jgi:hypothetical protein